MWPARDGRREELIAAWTFLLPGSKRHIERQMARRTNIAAVPRRDNSSGLSEYVVRTAWTKTVDPTDRPTLCHCAGQGGIERNTQFLSGAVLTSSSVTGLCCNLGTVERSWARHSPNWNRQGVVGWPKVGNAESSSGTNTPPPLHADDKRTIVMDNAPELLGERFGDVGATTIIEHRKYHAHSLCVITSHGQDDQVASASI